MLKLIKKYRKFLIIISFAYIYVLVALIAPSGFYALTPGEINSTNNVFEIENINFDNDFNTISVYSWHNITVFQKWLINNNNKYAMYKQNKTLKSDLLQGKISHESSLHNAIITAYTYAAKEDENIKINYNLTGLTVYATTNKLLEIGDLIVEINDQKINSNNYITYLEELNILNEENDRLIKNYNLKLTISRNNKLTTINLTEDEALIFYPKYEIISTSPQLKHTSINKNVGGPSGGMINALSIYTALLNINVNSKITGTGTIETNNEFEVGAIGGLIQKYYTVLPLKVDYFIIPENQGEKEIKQLLEIATNNQVKIIIVKNFQDCINIIKELT